MPDGKTLISIVAPVYNEESCIQGFVDEISDIIFPLKSKYDFELILVNDGSTDNTARILDTIQQNATDTIRIINFARNFGHISACSACLEYAKGDAVVLMDSDMQDDPKAILEFISHWSDGFDVVYAIRSTRRESFVMRILFISFYRLLAMVSTIRIPFDAGTFSLMSRRVVDQMNELPEHNRFLPGLRAYVGYRQAGIPVPRRERFAKTSRVGIKGLFALALNAFFSFSYTPIRLMQLMGGLVLATSFCVFCYVLFSKYVSHTAVTAWASQLVSTLFFGGINIICLGLIGEYVARIYDELKARPKFIIDRITESPKRHSADDKDS